MRALGVIDQIERVDLPLQLLERGGEGLLVEEAEQRLVEALVLALRGRLIGLTRTLEQLRPEAEPVTISVINRLSWRGGEGDGPLAEDLLACLRRMPLTGRVPPVDLDMLSSVLEGDPELSTGGYLDLLTSDAVRTWVRTDPAPFTCATRSPDAQYRGMVESRITRAPGW